MTVRQEFLRASLDQVLGHRDEFVEHFYQALFRRYPAFRPIFAEVDQQEQGERLLAALDTAIARWNEPRELVEALRELGRTYSSVAALAKHNTAVGESLLDALSAVLDTAWDSAAEAAWREAYDRVSLLLLSDALDVANRLIEGYEDDEESGYTG